MPAISKLVQPGGYPATTVPGLVRAIVDVYAAVAVAEGVAAPSIRFGRRYVERDAGPGRIVIVPRRGPWGGPTQMGKGSIGSVGLAIEVHIWSGETAVDSDDLENELRRIDAADAMVDRFLNVLRRVAPGVIETDEIDPDAGQPRAGSTNEHGETYVATFRYTRDVQRDAVVWGSSVLPTRDANGDPTPQLSPPPIHVASATATGGISIEPTTEPG